MPQGPIMEFEGPGEEDDGAVNERIGVDRDADATNWPVGLLFHAAGGTTTS